MAATSKQTNKQKIQLLL